MHLEASLEALRKIEDGDEGLGVLEEKLKEFGRLVEGIKKRRNVYPASPPGELEISVPEKRTADSVHRPRARWEMTYSSRHCLRRPCLK